MAPASIELDAYYRGDAWEGLHIGPMTEDGNPPAVPCKSARIHFRHPQTKELGYALNSTTTPGEGVITIVNPATYEFDIPKQVLTGLDTGTWNWDFETIDDDDMPFTWLMGELTVIQDQTYG